MSEMIFSLQAQSSILYTRDWEDEHSRKRNHSYSGAFPCKILRGKQSAQRANWWRSVMKCSRLWKTVAHEFTTPQRHLIKVHGYLPATGRAEGALLISRGPIFSFTIVKEKNRPCRDNSFFSGQTSMFALFFCYYFTLSNCCCFFQI